VITPDIILADGYGLAYPRGVGLAYHLGLLTDTPTIGCAKSILRGRPEGTLLPSVGAYVPLMDKGDVVSAAVRTRESVSPIYISKGIR
jgi:deoxyribonuclease V